MNITMTGASGFVGQNLQHYLGSRHQIHPLSVRFKKDQSWVLRDQAVIHLAGRVHDLQGSANASDYYQDNYELSRQLFDSFVNSSASVFIFMSSVKAAADQISAPLTEVFPPDPRTHYGISKREAEGYILSCRIPPGKRVYVLRPCMIHGPGNKGNLNLLYKLVSKSVPWPLGRFENQRSFLSIENLCFAVEHLLTNVKIPSGIYNLADDEPISTNRLIEIMNESLNKKSKIWRVPIFLVKFAGFLGSVLHLPFNSERLDKLTESYVVKNEKIVRAVGQKFPVSTESGLRKTLDAFGSEKRPASG